MPARSEPLDVTRLLYDGHPVWPGDTPFTLQEHARIADGSSVNLMRLSGTTHLGTHVDAPWHADDAGARLDEVPIGRLVGDALLLDARDASNPVGPEILPAGPLPGRVLLRTGQPDAWTAFPKSVRALAPALIHALADRGVRVVGTDAPSIDPLDSRDLPAHRACGARDVQIIEGLALNAATPGRWMFACLPLHLAGADAAPARALLWPPGDGTAGDA
ncbi:MAG: cyclase family protein [Trueperaceae bacterium]|nr:cyclase family protein [Trueperaceae bacterium]